MIEIIFFSFISLLICKCLQLLDQSNCIILFTFSQTTSLKRELLPLGSIKCLSLYVSTASTQGKIHKVYICS